MLTLTEKPIEIPAGTFAVCCAMCDQVVYLLPRPSNVKMAVEVVPGDDDHQHPRINQAGAGRAHLPHCRGGRR